MVVTDSSTISVHPPDGDLFVRPILAQNAPNPFARKTQIGFTLAETGRTRLSIYDLRGRLVETLIDEVRSAGPHMMEWIPARPVAPGVYFYRLESGGQAASKKLHLLE
jgi:hypothetical protein